MIDKGDPPVGRVDAETAKVTAESTTHPFEKSRERFGEISVVTGDAGARMVWSPDHTELRVNTKLFPTHDQARIATLRQVGAHIGLKQAMVPDSSALLELTKKYPDASEPVLRWQGLAVMRELNPTLLRDQPVAPQNQTFSQEFQWALDAYVLTGQYPDEMSDKVRQAVGNIPQTNNGRSLIDDIASPRYLKFDGKNFEKYIKPLIDELIEADKQTGRSEHYEYKPTPPPTFSENNELIQEGDITTRVTPFYGGYYREYVCHYDPATRKIVKEAGVKSTWSIDNPSGEEDVLETRKTYEGTIQPGQETLLKLPYGALPITSTLNSPNRMQFMRDDLGIVSIDPRQQAGASGVQISEPTKFSFDFVLAETSSNQLNVPPTDRDTEYVGGVLDPGTQLLIDDLSKQTESTDIQKAQEIALYVRTKLKYPQDEAETARIDSLYQSTESKELWAKITETGIANCYWANILRDELCKRLGIASRIATGPYIDSEDKNQRFDFTIVEAQGMNKHAWGEVWDPEKKVWTHEGMDATPGKEKNDSKDQDVDRDEQTTPKEGDFGYSDIFKLELGIGEIVGLYQELLGETDQTPSRQQSLEDIAAQQFEQERGVSLREWQQLEAWINEVNRTPVPQDASIRNEPSTLYDEYRSLFDLLVEKRVIQKQVYKGPVRQSEGEFLYDPATAVIDTKSGEDDPSGFQIETRKQSEHIEISAFDDDWIPDLSWSMQGAPIQELRKMVLSSTYNLMELDRRLQHANNRTRMRTPLHIRSTQIPFGDNIREVMRNATIDEKGLIKLDASLSSLMSGSRGLATALEVYKNSLDPQTLQEIREGKRKKMLTIVSDGEVGNQARCAALVKELRDVGVIVQGIGFGRSAQDIKIICNDPEDQDAAVVIDDVTQATLARHKMLTKHLSKI